MKLKRISGENFRLFESFELDFPDSNSIVFIGENGSGKSAVLDALAMGLAQFCGILNSSSRRSLECEIEKTDIRLAAAQAKFVLQLDIKNNLQEKILFGVGMNISKHGKKITTLSTNSNTKNYLERINSNKIENIPVVAYYRIGRTSFNEKSKKRTRKLQNKLLYTYENALSEQTSSFSDFQEWFINEENIENQLKIDKKSLDYKSESLEVIRKGLSNFLSCFEDVEIKALKVHRENKDSNNLKFSTNGDFQSYLVIQKGEEIVRLDRMSSGEKSIILLVADIARRLYLANESADALKGDGVVLIDEIELHLHPKWQRNIIPSLTNTFPNIQFVVSTHSPQVLSKVKAEDIIVFDNKTFYSASSSPLGRDSNGILEEIMGVDKRPSEVDDLIDEILNILAKKSEAIDYDLVENKIEKLKNQISKDDPILLKITNLLNRKKLLA